MVMGAVLSNAAAKAELERYFDRSSSICPIGSARFLHWLRQPSMLIVRIFVCLLLIVGGFLSFLPILGVWMLPLGLIIIAQDLPFLQPPLVRVFQWIERKWESWRPSRRAEAPSGTPLPVAARHPTQRSREITCDCRELGAHAIIVLHQGRRLQETLDGKRRGQTVREDDRCTMQ